MHVIIIDENKAFLFAQRKYGKLLIAELRCVSRRDFVIDAAPNGKTVPLSQRLLARLCR